MAELKIKVNAKVDIYIDESPKPVDEWISLKVFEGRLIGDSPSQPPRTAKQRSSLASERKAEEGGEDRDKDDGEEVVDSDDEAAPDATTVGESVRGAALNFEEWLQELKKYIKKHGEKCKSPWRAVRCVYSDAPSSSQSVGFSRRQPCDFHAVKTVSVALFLIPERFSYFTARPSASPIISGGEEAGTRALACPSTQRIQQREPRAEQG